MSIIPVLLISWIKRNEAVVIPQPAPLQKINCGFLSRIDFCPEGLSAVFMFDNYSTFNRIMLRVKGYGT